MNTKLTEAADLLFKTLEKAGNFKYIKRLPHPNPKPGRRWIYFYTQQQIKDYKEKGIIPGEEKPAGGVLSGIMSFFGFKSKAEAEKKAEAEYEKNKDKVPGVDKKSFIDHLNEYLSNKEKWDSKLSKEPGEKKEAGEKKEPAEKTEKKESAGEGSKFKLSVMRAIAGIYGGKAESKSDSKDNFETMPEGVKEYTIVDNDNPSRTAKVKAKSLNEAKDKGASELKTTNIRTYEKKTDDKSAVMTESGESFSKDYKDFAEGVLSDVKKNKDLADTYIERTQKDIKQSGQRIKSIKKEAKPGDDYTGAISKFEERIKDASILNRKLKEITGEYPSKFDDKSSASPLATAADELEKKVGGEKGSGDGGEKIFNNDGEKYTAIRKDAEEKFKDIKDKDEFNKKYNEFIKDNQNNYLTKEEKGYKDYLAGKGISKEKNNEIIKSSRNTFSNNGVQYSIAKGVRGYNLVGGEGAGKEIKVPYNRRDTIKDVMDWAAENIGFETWKLQDDNAEKSKSKYKSQSDVEKEKTVQAEKERTSKLAGDEKSLNIYAPDAKKLTYGTINYTSFKDATEKKVMEILKPKNMITDNGIKDTFDFGKEGQDAGVWTDSRMMILDKKVSDEIYNTNKQREFLRLKKQGKTDDEAIAEIVKKSTSGQFPNYKQVIPSEYRISKTESKFTGEYSKGEGKNSPDIVKYSDGENTNYFKADYIATIKNKFPDAKMYSSGEMSPMVFKVGNEVRAVLMPMLTRSDLQMTKLEKGRSQKASALLLAELQKAKKMPIGTVNAQGYKKVAEGKWVKDSGGKKPEKDKPESPKDKKEPEKTVEKKVLTDENKSTIKNTLKKVASILADALSGRDTVTPTGQAVEQAGETMKKPGSKTIKTEIKTQKDKK